MSYTQREARSARFSSRVCVASLLHRGPQRQLSAWSSYLCLLYDNSVLAWSMKSSGRSFLLWFGGADTESWHLLLMFYVVKDISSVGLRYSFSGNILTWDHSLREGPVIRWNTMKTSPTTKVEAEIHPHRPRWLLCSPRRICFFLCGALIILQQSWLYLGWFLQLSSLASARHVA